MYAMRAYGLVAAVLMLEKNSKGTISECYQDSEVPQSGILHDFWPQYLSPRCYLCLRTGISQCQVPDARHASSPSTSTSTTESFVRPSVSRNFSAPMSSRH